MIVALLVACTADLAAVDAERPIDTGRVVDDPTVRAGALFDAYDAPIAAWRRAWIWKTHTATDCPTAYDAGGGITRVGGDCTDDDGVTWGGTLEVLEVNAGQKITFDRWSRADTTGFATWEGEMVRPSDDGVVTTITERDSEGTLTRAWSKLTTSPWTAVEIAHEGGAAAWTTTGAMTVDGAIYAVSASFTELGACASEPDDGALAFTGFDTVTFDFDGSVLCDGCVPFTDRAGANTLCHDR